MAWRCDFLDGRSSAWARARLRRVPCGHRKATQRATSTSQPEGAADIGPGGRLYWQESYSGGPIDVAPLPPGLPGEHYKPVVVPNGAALPFKVVDGVKVFHVIVDEVDHAFDSGLGRSAGGTTVG